MSHSHPATRQDLWVLKHFGVGTFCELGAYDGVTHSNTWLLEQRGWTGVLVEGVPGFAEQCGHTRPNCKVVNKVIGKGGHELYVWGGQYSGVMRTMPIEFLQGHLDRKNPTYSVYTTPLDMAVGLGPFTYLSVDTEGGEYEILKAWLEAGGIADAITVEFRFCDKEFARLTWLMEQHNFDLDEIRGFDLCFLRRK